jgi:hypothetical protein
MFAIFFIKPLNPFLANHDIIEFFKLWNSFLFNNIIIYLFTKFFIPSTDILNRLKYHLVAYNKLLLMPGL